MSNFSSPSFSENGGHSESYLQMRQLGRINDDHEDHMDDLAVVEAALDEVAAEKRVVRESEVQDSLQVEEEKIFENELNGARSKEFRKQTTVVSENILTY